MIFKIFQWIMYGIAITFSVIFFASLAMEMWRLHKLGQIKWEHLSLKDEQKDEQEP